MTVPDMKDREALTERLLLLDGYIIVFGRRGELMTIVSQSADEAESLVELQFQMGLSPLQARAVLVMPIGVFSAASQQQITSEHDVIKLRLQHSTPPQTTVQSHSGHPFYAAWRAATLARHTAVGGRERVTRFPVSVQSTRAPPDIGATRSRKTCGCLRRRSMSSRGFGWWRRRSQRSRRPRNPGRWRGR